MLGSIHRDSLYFQLFAKRSHKLIEDIKVLTKIVRARDTLVLNVLDRLQEEFTMYPIATQENQWQFYQLISDHETFKSTNQRLPYNDYGSLEPAYSVPPTSVPAYESITPPPVNVTSGRYAASTASTQNGCYDVRMVPVCREESTSQHNQIRLPTIKTTPNIANNVMSEECDLGYFSFSDLASHPETHEASNRSNDSDGLFNDIDQSFSDIIDDVLGSIDEKPTTAEFDDGPLSSPVTSPTATSQRVQSSTPPLDIVYDQTPQFTADEIISPPFYPAVFHSSYFVVPPKQTTEYVHTNSVPFCAICSRSFQTKASLKVHMRSHRGDRPHACTFCPKSFTQKSTLRTHIRTHTGEKPFVCSFCSRAFSDYSTFRKHVRVHTGEKPYVCDVCKKGFTQSGNMLRHRETHFKK